MGIEVFIVAYKSSRGFYSTVDLSFRVSVFII